VERVVRRHVAYPQIRYLDYGIPEGKRRYQQIGGGKVPATIFDSSLDADKKALAGLRASLTTVGAHRVLRPGPGASWNPRCADAGGCKLAECKKLLMCRPLKPKQVELFVMSKCSFCTRAFTALKSVLGKVGQRQLKVRVYYVASGSAKKGFRALHGPAEIDENKRALCAIKVYARRHKYLDYITCRNQNQNSHDWRKCTGRNGINAAILQRCAAGLMGNRLLDKSAKLTKSLQINAAPTWIANGRYKFHATSESQLLFYLCRHNPKLRGCASLIHWSP